MSRIDPTLRRAAAVAWLALVLAGRAALGAWTEQQRLAPSDLRSGDQFGAAVAVGDGVIAVGAYLSDAGGKDSGAVYVFQKKGCRFEQTSRLIGAPGEWFGFDVAIDGSGTSSLVVGAPNPEKGAGAAYVYDIDAQGVATLSRRLVAGVSSGAELGSAVAIAGEYIAVGARGDEQRGGTLHLFTRGGTPVPLPNLPSVAGTELGQSVALRGKTLAAGAPQWGKDRKFPGAVYRWQLTDGTWKSLEPLVPNGLEPGAAFGYSVSVVDGEKGDVIVGAPLADSQAGAAYRCSSSGCTQLQINASKGDQLGVAVASVAMAKDGERILVGARGVQGSRGAAYLVEGTLQTLTPSLRQERAEFGFSVGFRGDTIAVGAFREGGTGAAYVFEPPQLVTVTLRLKENAAVNLREGAGSMVQVVAETNDHCPLRAEATVTVSGEGTAQFGSDYSFTEPEPPTFPAGTADLAEKEVSISTLTDCEDETKETFTLSLSEVTGATMEPDSKVKFTIVDSASVDGILVLPETEPFTTKESGTEDEVEATFQVMLTCQPTDGVSIALTSTDPSEGNVTLPNPLTFNSSNWNVPQQVTVAGQDDSECDGDQDYEIKIEASSDDPGYDELTETVAFKNEDDGDSCGDVQVGADVCVEIDGTVLYTVKIENTGSVPLTDRDGFEIFGPLPDEVTVVTASADIGVATVDYIQNEVAWTGSIPVAKTATIQIVAALEPDVDVGSEVEYRGTYRHETMVDRFKVSFTVGQPPCP